MKQRPRIYYTEADKSLIWDRWQKGETMGSIGLEAGIGRGEGKRGEAFGSAG